MSNLFDNAPPPPLAEALRPKTIEEVIGQAHLLANGKPLNLAFASGKPHSMILWGPPGVGKTTLARLSAKAFDREFIAISAVLAGVKEIREAIEQAQRNMDQYGKQTILFVDEIHRFNKSQQDALLPHVESGLFTFIGATTENPSFEVNSALLSRAQVYVLKSLTPEELKLLFKRAHQHAMPEVQFESTAIDTLISNADGDARRLLNLVEQVRNAVLTPNAEVKVVDQQFIENALSAQAKRFDKGGDHFYDQISALHKSVRGSNPDGALYWMQRMLDGGAEPLYVGRRLVRMAIEDIGLADPRALEICLNACQTYERLGSPEGELAFANAVIYLAIAAKSNAVYMAYNQVKSFVAQDQSRPVPLHLRNAPTKLMKHLDYGKNYRYAHNEEGAYAAGEQYLPDGLEEVKFYEPTNRGLEGKISEKLAQLAALDKTAKRQK